MQSHSTFLRSSGLTPKERSWNKSQSSVGLCGSATAACWYVNIIYDTMHIIYDVTAACWYVNIYDTIHIIYDAQQPGKPSVNCEACRLVLKSILLHPQLLVKAWRTRLYYYSSGSTFQLIATDLKHWVDTNENGDKYFRQVGKYACTKATYIMHCETYM